MPMYKANGVVVIGSVRYESGQMVVLQAGEVRDSLIAGDSIYRADLPPHSPRGLLADVVQLPYVEEPDGSGGKRLVLLDEWAIPDEQWPWPGPWGLYPRRLAPAKFRPIY